MPRKPPILKLHEMKPNSPAADCFALLTEKTLQTTRDGNKFFKCRFRDARRSAEAAIWSNNELFSDCEDGWIPGTIYKIRCVYSEKDRYGPVITIVQIREASVEDEADGLNLDDFYVRSRLSPDDAFTAIRELAESELSDDGLKVLTLKLLDEHADALKPLPATSRQFYPFPGGWLEHTLAVATNSLWLADQYRERYPDLIFNRDLVLTAALLHDIGRVKELIPSLLQPAEATVEGRLLGHVTLGRDLIRAAARDLEVNPELLMLLDHLLLVHLELPEWGSPRLPMIPEALILHHVDDLDAKFEMYARLLLRDGNAGPFTDRDPVLGKQLLKRRNEPDA